ncbi:MAG: hypothetical protein V2A73_04325, partial [Pseudomonadota bacterium]
ESAMAAPIGAYPSVSMADCSSGDDGSATATGRRRLRQRRALLAATIVVALAAGLLVLWQTGGTGLSVREERAAGVAVAAGSAGSAGSVASVAGSGSRDSAPAAGATSAPAAALVPASVSPAAATSTSGSPAASTSSTPTSSPLSPPTSSAPARDAAPRLVLRGQEKVLVFLDGRRQGETPLEIEISPGQPHVIMLIRRGFRDGRAEIPPMLPGEERILEVALQPVRRKPRSEK